ncbi:3204_t:CDS:2 [Dentiscutata erythropus]|uniref:3204_t:CDS:1 n=1 Tax=Dentiscutata erythropus TaxID=1348616 RepID=A0A9N9HQ31_9GLOM|nr:3204_t:CDS:2 [Dentiscutata erythropus]
MTDEEALICNFTDDEYIKDDNFVNRVEKCKAFGTQQGADDNEKWKAHQVAQAYHQQFPSNVQITPPGVIKYYMEKRLPYSSSVPFTNYYKKRLELYQAR